MRIALYLRVSTDRQTTDSQAVELRNYCARRGWTDVIEYSDTASGAISKPPRQTLGNAPNELLPLAHLANTGDTKRTFQTLIPSTVLISATLRARMCQVAQYRSTVFRAASPSMCQCLDVTRLSLNYDSDAPSVGNPCHERLL